MKHDELELDYGLPNSRCSLAENYTGAAVRYRARLNASVSCDARSETRRQLLENHAPRSLRPSECGGFPPLGSRRNGYDDACRVAGEPCPSARFNRLIGNWFSRLHEVSMRVKGGQGDIMVLA
jgi:hypothetical protein